MLSKLSRWQLVSNKKYLFYPLQAFSSTLKVHASNSTISSYKQRHIGPQEEDQVKILSTLNLSSFDELLNLTIPSHIRLSKKINLPNPLSETDALNYISKMMAKNKVFKSYIGLGYYNTITPTVILRNLIENPSWYTPYTPYQAEISQGRLEMLLNFQTMISDLVGKEVCNASLLDEATSCAEAISTAWNILRRKRNTFLISSECHIQNIEVCKSRSKPLNINIKVVNDNEIISNLNEDICGVLVQYPNTNGGIKDYKELTNKIHSNGSLMIASTDLLACTKLVPPGEWGADIVVGVSQRFGVPLGYGGPHAGFMATDKKHARKLPGRIIGVAPDSRNKQSYRMSIQAREQHIRRESATSNICTAQALLANVSAAYAIYHGPKGLKGIADKVNNYTQVLKYGLEQLDMKLDESNNYYFDTIKIKNKNNISANKYLELGYENSINFRDCGDNKHISISLDETTTLDDINDIFNVIANVNNKKLSINACDISNDILSSSNSSSIPNNLMRKSNYLEHPIFNSYQSETSMMRYLYSLEKKDLGLNTAMIPLGSCTMKLNSATVMTPLSWKEINSIHPFVPVWQSEGYQQMFDEMEEYLCEMTGFKGISFQPNAGSQGEYTGLMCIRKYHESRGDNNRVKVLIPMSAHGTNPATATMVGYEVVAVKSDSNGNVDVNDLELKAKQHKDSLAGIMITYPSTHGVYEESIVDICKIVHENGGLVYMDGANLQAQVGFCNPGFIGADVCHLNLHKTYCIPHGGGGPGLGPIGVNEKLLPFLPSHPIIPCGKDESNALGPIAGSPWSSASILTISWMYIRMMGTDGIEDATKLAIANANYMMFRLKDYYDVLYTGKNNYCAHEFIIDIRPLKKKCGVTAEDVAKRLADYGFHAPTMSFPVAETLMIEPTESEPLNEIDRLCEGLIKIREEIKEIEDGKYSIGDSPLRNSPHTIDMIIANDWNKKYSRECAAGYNLTKQFWPTVGRIDNTTGDKTLICTCPSMEDYI